MKMELREVIQEVVEDHTKAVTPEGYKLKEVKAHGTKWVVTYTLIHSWAIKEFLKQFTDVKKNEIVPVSRYGWFENNQQYGGSFVSRLTGWDNVKSLYTFSYLGYRFAVLKSSSTECNGIVIVPNGHYVNRGDNMYQVFKEFFERAPKFSQLPERVATYEYENYYKYLIPNYLLCQ